MESDTISHAYYYTDNNLRIDIMQTDYLVHQMIKFLSIIDRTISFYQQPYSSSSI